MGNNSTKTYNTTINNNCRGSSSGLTSSLRLTAPLSENGSYPLVRRSVNSMLRNQGAFTSSSGGDGVLTLESCRKMLSIFDEGQLSREKKTAFQRAIDAGDNTAATRALCEAGEEKIGSYSRLSAESGGRRIVKSVHETYLRAYKDEDKVDMAERAQDWERWYVEDHGGNVVFKAIHSPGRFLCAYPNKRVDLVDRLSDGVMWVPIKNCDGTWSFLSIHGHWLSANRNCSVECVDICDSWESFRLSNW